MNVQLQRLVALQELDIEISEQSKILGIIPKQISKGEAELEEKKGKLKSALNVIESLKKNRSQLEQDVVAENDHMAKTKGKLPNIKTNKEYSALLSEVDAIKEKIGRLEEQELEIMEELEEKEKEIPGLKSEFEGYEKEFLVYKKQKEEELARVRKELDDKGKKRDGLAQSIDPPLFRHYGNVIKLRGDRAVVLLESGICQGCFQQIRPQLAIEIKKGEELNQCQYCDRYLYWVPKTETEDQTQTTVSK